MAFMRRRRATASCGSRSHWQISPLVRWEKEYNWHSDFGIRVGFDALFWDLER